MAFARKNPSVRDDLLVRGGGIAPPPKFSLCPNRSIFLLGNVRWTTLGIERGAKCQRWLGRLDVKADPVVTGGI